MRHFKIFLFCLVSVFFIDCKKITECAMLYYTPHCATIYGYVIFDDNKEGRVFLKDIDSKFQKDSVHVCLKYEELGEATLTADCYTYKAIKILRIE